MRRTLRQATMFYLYERKDGDRAEIGITLRSADVPTGALTTRVSNQWISTQAIQVKRAKLAALGFAPIDPETANPQRWERRDTTMAEDERLGLDDELRAFKEEALQTIRAYGANLRGGMTDEQQRQIRQWLTTQPPHEIVERNDRNNLDFITWSVKWAIVRYAFPDASIRMGEHWDNDDGYHVTVIITTAGVEHEGLGFEPRKSEKQIVAYSDSGYKAAYSDAVSRACALVGVGLMLYMDVPISKALIRLLTGEVGTSQPAPKSEPEPQPQTITAPQDDDVDPEYDSSGQQRPVEIVSKYKGKCSDCGRVINKGDAILYDARSLHHKVRCSTCMETYFQHGADDTEPEPAAHNAAEQTAPIPVPSTVPQAPEDVGAWRQKGDASKSVQELVSLIKAREQYLGANAMAGYRDPTVLRDTRVHFLDGTAALNNKPAYALAGYLAWLNHEAEANTPAQHP